MTKVSDFLKKHNQSPCQVDIDRIFSAVQKEIELGLEKPCSMPMIPTYLGEDFSPICNKKVLLIDAGGTNFRSAVGYFDDEKTPHIEDICISKMPASQGKLTKEQFYSQIAQNVSNQLKDTTDVGFCFSYNVAMTPDVDGTVAALSKELNAPQVLGTKVGKCTLDAISAHDSKQRKIVVLNDTVATLIAGKLLHGDAFQSYIGFIFGTGSNACYIENTANIKKLASGTFHHEKMIINMECGGFNKLTQGQFDLQTAQNTMQPELQMFEKMTSGKYLGETIFHALTAFGNQNNFSQKVNIPQFSLKDVSDFLQHQKGILQQCFQTQTDVLYATEICQNIIDRAAKLWAIFNAAVAKRVATSNSKPVAIVAEGTTFYKLAGFRQSFEHYLDLITTQHNFKCQVVEAKQDLNLLGSLAAICKQ